MRQVPIRLQTHQPILRLSRHYISLFNFWRFDMIWPITFPIDIFFYFLVQSIKKLLLSKLICCVCQTYLVALHIGSYMSQMSQGAHMTLKGGGGALMRFVWMINFLKANLRIGWERFERCCLWHLRYLFDSRKTRTLQWHTNCEAGADHKIVVHYLSLLKPRSKGVQVSLFL